MSPSPRTRRGIALGVVLLAVLFAVPRFLTHTPYPRMGISIDFVGPDKGTAVVHNVVGPPGLGLLKRGDIIRELDGRPYTVERLMKSRYTPDRRPLSMLIERDGEQIAMTLPPLELSAWQRMRVMMAQMVAVCAVPLVAFLLVWRRPDLTASWVFLWFAVLQAVATVWGLFRYPQVEAAGTLKAYLGVYEIVVLWLPAAFLHFMTVFPRPRWTGARRRQSVWFWLVALAYLTPVALLAANRFAGANLLRMYMYFQAVALPLGTLSLIERYARRARPEWNPQRHERAIAIVVAVTILVGVGMDMVPEKSILPFMQFPLFRLLTTVLIFGWLASPLLIAYLIANDPIFDPRRLVLRSLPYAALTGILAALYLGVVVLSQRFFAAATGEEAAVFNVLAALVVAFAFAPLRERLQRGLDRLYGRDPHALRIALDRAGRRLLGALSRDEVRGAVAAAVRGGLRRPVAIEWPDEDVPRLAEGEELGEDERVAIENLLVQARIRLENLALHDERTAAERREVELRSEATRAELRALHAQVQPHFVFNALNALAYLIEIDPPAAQRFTERLADMLRYTVEAGERPAALLSDEIQFVEDYLGVAGERYENPLSFKYVGPPELLSTPVPPLLLQPLVENSIKHGCCGPDCAPLHLSLDTQRENGWVTIVFLDDGMGTGDGNGLGSGLQNLEQRIRHFGGSEASMEAGPRSEGGFAVTMRWRMSRAEAAA